MDPDLKGFMIFIAGLFACAALIVGVINVIDMRERPMPCNSEQVYVWVDYPVDAKCVSNRDHSQHGD